MEKINNQKYALTLNEFVVLGARVEELIKQPEYGTDNLDNLDQFDLDELALRVIEGMTDLNWKNNKEVLLPVEKINNRKYALTLNEFVVLGARVQGLLELIKQREYDKYNAAHFDLDEKLALRVIEGMSDWQWKHNKGVQLHGDTNIRIKIYDMHELQDRMEKAMEEFNPGWNM